MSHAKPEPKALPKRFYAAAEVQQKEQGFCICLDGKPIKTPRQKLLHCASQQLAQQIAAEWEAQREVINTDSMPLTRLLNIALDRVSEDRAQLLADIDQYGDTDLLFYREPVSGMPSGAAGSASPLAGEATRLSDPLGALSRSGEGALSEADTRVPPSPLATLDPLPQGERVPPASPLMPSANSGRATAADALALLQAQHFTPILDWCSKTYGLTFRLAQGVMPVSQPPESLETLRSIFAQSTDHELAALAMMVPLLGSALLALAIWKGGVTLEEALIAARLDESVQANYWGEDMEARAKWEAKARDIRASAFFLTCK